MKRKRIVVGAVAVGLLGLGYAIRTMAAGVPATNALSYSGVLEDGSGPMSGSRNVQALLYDAATDGNLLCQTTSATTPVTNGHFTVALPDACTQAVASNPDVWVDILVDGSDTGRAKIGVVPYAISAANAASASTATNATTAGVTSGLTANAKGGLTWFTVTSQNSNQASVALPANDVCSVVPGSSNVDCDCSKKGMFLVSGGGYGAVGVVLRESRPTSPTVWRTTCSKGGQDWSCANYTVLCSNLGPGAP